MTVHARVAAARVHLRQSGVSPTEAALDARLLAQFALGWTAERFLAAGHEDEPPGFAPRYQGLVDRRATREPLAYIVGSREFWGLPFDVSSSVLIPRPETELILEAALELFPLKTTAFDVVDVGTGSGCLAVALACERPSARVIATDISDRALDVARQNTERHGVSDRVVCRKANLLDGVVETVDLIVSNPPYVRDIDRPGLQPEVGNHEPAVALFGGADGLGVIRRLLAQAPDRLRPGGHLIFEFGFGQDEWIEELIAETSRLACVGLRRDLNGIARTAIAKHV
jgi:release factor glutamine methyltransferase